MVGSTVPYIHSPYGSLHPSIPPPLTLHRLRRAVPAEVKGEEGVWGSEEWVKDIKSYSKVFLDIKSYSIIVVIKICKIRTTVVNPYTYKDYSS